MRNTHYEIITVPDRVEYTCPYCHWKHSEDFDDFSDNFADEYEVWRANTNDSFDCENCNKSFNLNEVTY